MGGRLFTKIGKTRILGKTEMNELEILEWIIDSKGKCNPAMEFKICKRCPLIDPVEKNKEEINKDKFGAFCLCYQYPAGIPYGTIRIMLAKEKLEMLRKLDYLEDLR